VNGDVSPEVYEPSQIHTTWIGGCSQLRPEMTYGVLHDQIGGSGNHSIIHRRGDSGTHSDNMCRATGES
jgi:hypothetical protein